MISEKRIEEICDLYYGDVYRYCFSFVQDAEDAKDITQEIFIYFIQNASTLQDENIKAWLYSVALIKIKQHRHNKFSKSQNVSFDDLDRRLLLEQDRNYTIEDSLSQYLYDDQRIEEEKQKILDSLTPNEHKLYYDAYVKKKKYSEIAQDKDISEITVSVQTFRLRNKIRAIIKTIFDFCFMFLI